MSVTPLDFALRDNGSSVEIEVHRANCAQVKYQTFSPRKVPIRQPLPKKEHLIENLSAFAEAGLCGGSFEENLNYYIHCRHQDISEQILEILKSVRRIEKLQESIKLAKKWGMEHTMQSSASLEKKHEA